MAGAWGGEIVMKWTRDALMIGDFSLRYYGMLIVILLPIC